MQFVFDIRKAIAATGYLCKLNQGSLNILHLIKMLYAADRTALVNWHRTITGDKFYSMKNGPVLSRIYDLMCGKILGSDMDEWRAFFNPREANTISLRRDPDIGPLSKRETDILELAYEKFKDVPVGKLVEFLHSVLPEWKDPGASSAPIDPRDILFAEGLSEEEVFEIEQELSAVLAAKVALQCPRPKASSPLSPHCLSRGDCRSASKRATTWRVSMPSLMTLRATRRFTGSCCSAM